MQINRTQSQTPKQLLLVNESRRVDVRRMVSIKSGKKDDTVFLCHRANEDRVHCICDTVIVRLRRSFAIVCGIAIRCGRTTNGDILPLFIATNDLEHLSKLHTRAHK